jgi:hypothetical protein
MILLWCLCVALLLTGLALLRQIHAALSDTWLHFFGKRVRVPAGRPRPNRERPVARDSRQRYWPPVRVQTRAGP